MKRKSKAYPLVQPTTEMDWALRAPNREFARRAVANKWLGERQYTKYRYNVERCEDGCRVYLLRPTWLNKGFDFMVNVEGFRSRTRKPHGASKEMPSHDDVIHDLREKTSADPKHSGMWFDAVCAVYECQEPRVVLARHDRIRRPVLMGLPADQLLYIIKWLFIEQDLTYWLYTGRDKLMNVIETDVFGVS